MGTIKQTGRKLHLQECRDFRLSSFLIKYPLQGHRDLAILVELMKQEEFTSLVNTIGDLIDKRAKTTETLIKGEITSVRSEIGESEERLSKRIDEAEEHMHVDVLAARAEAHADNLTLNANLVKKILRHERRITNLEEHTHTDDPTKN